MREGKGPWVPLWRILFWADAFKRLVLGQSEIEHAVHRLAPAGPLVLSFDGEFALTPAVRELLASCVLDDAAAAEEAIERVESNLPDVQGSSTWSLPEDTWRRAYDAFEGELPSSACVVGSANPSFRDLDMRSARSLREGRSVYGLGSFLAR